MTDPREQHLSEAFTQPRRLKIGNLEARPITIGTINAAKQLGLTILDGENPSDTHEMLRQLTAVLWLQTQPEDEVFEALEAGVDVAERKIRRFAMDIPLEVLDQFRASVEKADVRAAAASVEVVAKSGAAEKDAPPNG